MNILHIDCSPRTESHSRRLSAALVGKLLDGTPNASVTRRDLTCVPMPHVASDYATALSSPATLAAPPNGSLEFSDMLIREVEAADAIVIGTPMHNLTVPSVLKAWIDVSDSGEILASGYSGGGLIGSTTLRLAKKSITFTATAYPDLQQEPVVTPTSVTFVQTAGGCTGAPMPRRVNGPPFVQWQAPTAWSTLTLTINNDGTSANPDGAPSRS